MQVPPPPPPDSTNPPGQPWQAMPSLPNNQMGYPNPRPTPPLPPDSTNPTGQTWQTAPYDTQSDQLTMPSSRPLPSSPNNQMGYSNPTPAPPPPYPYSQSTPSGEYTAPTFGTNPQLPPPSAKPRNVWKTATLVLSILVVLLLLSTTALTYALVHTSHSTTTTGSSSNSTPIVQTTSPVSTAAPATPTTPVYATATSTSSTPTSGTPTTVPSSQDSYTATQPGPGCDSSGGIWTPQGPIGNITCGTQITVNANQGRGYLFLQLPGNKAFSPNNTISVTGSVGYDGGSQLYSCIGLAEQSASIGYLVEYCNNGAWFIDSISSTGAIVQTLSKNITSTRSTETISLTLKGATLSFAIDTEVHNVNITSIQPTKVAITAYEQYANNQITAGNFSYIVLS